MRARNHELVPRGAQARRAETAQAVSERDGLDVVARLDVRERGLQRGAELVGAVMQADLEPPDFGEVFRALRVQRDLAFKYAAREQREARRARGGKGWRRSWHGCAAD